MLMMQYCDYSLYHKLQRECDPEEHFAWIREELIPSLAEYDKEMAEEAERWVDCTSGFLRRYMKFAAGCMTDAELYKFYDDILEMLDTGIEARRSQKSLVDYEVEKGEELYHNEVIDEDEYELILYNAEAIKEALDEDIKMLEDLKEFCLKAKDRFDVVMCIEKVANTAHERGSMLPVMCGAYLHEDIVEAVTGIEEYYEFARPEDIGFELSKETQYVFNCIKWFKG